MKRKQNHEKWGYGFWSANPLTGQPVNRLTNHGQSTLEMTAALIVLMILLVGAAKIFVWLNERMAWRQSQYENTRVAAGSTAFTSYVDLANPGDTRGLEVDESSNPPLNIFR